MDGWMLLNDTSAQFRPFRVVELWPIKLLCHYCHLTPSRATYLVLLHEAHPSCFCSFFSRVSFCCCYCCCCSCCCWTNNFLCQEIGHLPIHLAENNNKKNINKKMRWPQTHIHHVLSGSHFHGWVNQSPTWRCYSSRSLEPATLRLRILRYLTALSNCAI